MTAAVVLLAIASGAFLTSAKQGYAVHVALSVAAIAAMLYFARTSRFARASLAAMAISAAIGWLAPSAAVWHAVIGHLAIAFAAAAVISSAKIDPISPGEWHALRPAALVAPLAVYFQIAMGALYRHQVTGIMPHMFGAMVVALLSLVVSVIVLQHFGERRDLKKAATSLISAVLLQVCLGVTAFVMQLLEANTNPAYVWISAAHVTVGSVVLAAGVLMAIEVFRNFSAR